MLTDKELLKEAKERYQKCEDAWGSMKQRWSEILRFVSGDQWIDSARQNFENNGYAAITSNRMPTFLRQITNDFRKNVPQGQVDPKDDATVDTAEVINDMIRNIQQDSNADIAYTKAAESACTIGIGYFRVGTEYESDKSFNQKFVVDAIPDACSVMVDPNHKSLTGSDCDYGFIATALTKDEYKRKYPKSALASDMEDKSWTAAGKFWCNNDQIIIVEYFFKDYSTETLYDTFNTLTGERKSVTELNKEYVDAGYLVVLDKRPIQVATVRWTKLNDVEVLEKSIFPSKYIPIILVKGDEYWLENERVLVGAVEPAMDAQVMLNYNLTLMSQLIQMAPKAPYIGTADQFRTYEQEWANVNVSNQAFMTYNKDEGAPPPTRDLGEVPIQNMSNLVAQAENSLQRTFGTFDPSNQTVAPESGKAILARQSQAYNSNYHFYDNIAKSIEHAICIIVEGLPIVYDTARTIQAVNISGEKRSENINTAGEDGTIEHDLSKGSYAVSIQTGPSFGTKRQEAVMAVTEIMGLSPVMAQNLADLAIINMDIPGAKEIAARARAMVDPKVLEASSTGNKMEPEQVVIQLKQQLQAIQEELQVTKQVGQELNQELNISKQENKLIKMDKQIDMVKAEMDFKLKSKGFELQEQKTELEFLIKEQELVIQQSQLKIEEAKLSMMGVKAMSDMDHGIFEKQREHIERVATMRPGESELSIGDMDAVEGAAPSDLMSAPSGMGNERPLE